jgi:hypothetical protein
MAEAAGALNMWYVDAVMARTASRPIPCDRSALMFSYLRPLPTSSSPIHPMGPQLLLILINDGLVSRHDGPIPEAQGRL